MRVTEWNGDVVFLHEVVPGAADRSYGIQVAKLAGPAAPPPSSARATILAELEAGARVLAGRAPARRPAAVRAPCGDTFRGPGGAADRRSAVAALDAIDPDDLTPKAALEALYALKRVRAAG